MSLDLRKFRIVACVQILIVASLLPVHALPRSAKATRDKPFAQYFHRVWTTEQGLPQNSAKAIIETRDHYIWIGTLNGLARYNGTSFTIFTTHTTPELKSADIWSLVETPDSTLWIGTSRGLTTYKKGIFTYLPSNAGTDKEIIRSLALDHEGTLWIGTSNAGLHLYKKGRFEFPIKEPAFVDARINAIAEDMQGNIWISTFAAIMVLRNHTWISYPYPSLSPNTLMRGICIARDSSVWIGTSNGVVRHKDGTFRTYTTADGLPDNVVLFISQDRAGAIWIGTERGGVCRYVNETFSTYGTSDGLSSKAVDAILQDHEGNYWVGTFTGGVNQFWKGKFTNYTTRNGLPDFTSRTMIQARNSDVWIGTEGGGVLRFDGKQFTTYNTRNRFPNDFVRSLFEDSHGTIWIGTRGGLVQFTGGKFHVFTTQDGLSDNYISAIGEDAEGGLWVGTVNAGIHRMVNGTFVQCASTSLLNGRTRTIFTDHSGVVWIGGESGLVQWRNGVFSRFAPKGTKISEEFYFIKEDRDNVLWLGSNGGGLVRIKNDTITRFSESAGLPIDEIFQMLEDNSGNVWISSRKGLYCVAKKMLNDYAEGKIARVQYTSFNASDGMIASECLGLSQPAGCKTLDGRLWFPTAKGIVVFDPNNIAINTLPPAVVIERAKLNGVDKSTDFSGVLVVPPGSGEVELHYAALTYASQEKVFFRYKLDGYDDDWSVPVQRRVKYYTNLPPGRYVFRVIACNNDGIWNEKGTALAFELLPYFYQTWWFYGMIMLALVGCVFGVYRWRMRQFLLNERKLRQRVDEAVAQIKILGGLIPICANCKKIRDDKGYWNQLEKYIDEHSEATFSHGICPECKEALYGKFISDRKKQKENQQSSIPPAEDTRSK